MPHKLAIVGYGKMGRMIEQLAPEYGFTVALKLDEFNNAAFRRRHRGQLPRHRRGGRFFDPAGRGGKHGAHRRAGRQHRGRHYRLAGSTRARQSRCGAPPDRLGLESELFRRRERLFPPGAEAARLLASEPAYGAWAWEIHHAAKKDAPSGTLLKLVEEMKKSGLRAPHRRERRTARERIPARTKSASIRRPTPSLCGTPRAAAKALRAAR